MTQTSVSYTHLDVYKRQLYKSNDRRNVLAPDRLHYDVLNQPDLSRDGGLSGDIELTHVNWGNYDLVVTD